MRDLMRDDPFVDLVRTRWIMHRLMDWADDSLIGEWTDTRKTLALDVIEQPDALLIKASLPGFSEKDIDVSVKGDHLVISAKQDTTSEQEGGRWHVRERRNHQYYRELPIPAELRDKPAKAELENGVLTIRFPKNNPGPLEALKGTVKRILPKVALPQLTAKHTS